MLRPIPTERRSAVLGLVVWALAIAAPGYTDEAASNPESVTTSDRGASEGAARSEPATGADLYQRGDFSAAIESWRAEEARLGPTGAAAERIALLLRIADAEQALGHYRDAVRTLESALAAAGESADAAQLAAIHGSLGNALIAIGPPEAAREQLERGIGIAREAGASTNAG